MLDNVKFCCTDMERQIKRRCSDHGNDIWTCTDCLICYCDCFDEFGLIVHDGGTSYIQILFCPFCGHRLPPSKRKSFFDLLDDLKLEWDSSTLPQEFHTDEWWRKRGL